MGRNGARPDLDIVLADVLGIQTSQITDELAMSDLDTWDSLKHMEVISAVESAFGVELTFDEIVTMRSVGEIRRVLESHESAP